MITAEDTDPELMTHREMFRVDLGQNTDNIN